MASNYGYNQKNVKRNDAYDNSDESDGSHHSYIDPREWHQGANFNQTNIPGQVELPLDNAIPLNENFREKPQLSMDLVKELPSRNFGLTGNNTTGNPRNTLPSDHSIGTIRMKSGNIVMRQSNVNEDQLYNALKNDTEATPEEIKETLRNINQSLTLKRNVKARLSRDLDQRKRHNLSCMKRLKYRMAMFWQNTKHEIEEMVQSLDLWHSHLKTIQGHFGSGVASYFFFLRWLFFLNVFAFIILLAFVVTPQLVNTLSKSGSNLNNTNTDATVRFTGQELMTGTGYFDNTIMYYGYYTNATIGGSYSMPDAYLFANSAYIICCMVFLTYSLAKSYRLNYIETSSDINNKFSNKVLSAWDYSIEREHAARLKSRSIYNELMELIESETKDSDGRTVGEKFYIYFWRIFINLVILTAMAGLGYIAYKMLTEKQFDNVTIPFLKEITLAIAINTALFIVPIIFTVLSSFESYTSKQTQLYLNMIRTVIIRIVVLGVVTYVLLDRNNENRENLKCWETKLGQEVYRLIIVDLLCVFLFSTVVMELLRRICFDNGLKCIGNPEFDIAQNTLDLIYTQTLTWIGFFYCPLLPLVTLIKLVVIFYTKRLSVVQNCRPSLKPWRVAHVQTVFLTLTFVSFVLSAGAVGYSILKLRPSEDCGPFRGMVTTYTVVMEMLEDLKDFAIVVSPGAVSGLILFLGVVVYYTRASAKAHEEMVNLLRDQLIMEGKDKVFLLQLFDTAMQHRTASFSVNGKSETPAPKGILLSPKSKDEPKPVESAVFNKTYHDYLLPSETNATTPIDNKSNPNYGVRYIQADVPVNRRESSVSNVVDHPNLPQPKPGWGKHREKTPEAWIMGERRGSGKSSTSTPTRDGSPFSVIPEHVRSASPTGSWDRRRSQTPRRGPVPPPISRAPHQQGFQYLSQDSPNYSPTRSRNPTPQRF